MSLTLRAENASAAFAFDDRNITWKRLPGFDHFDFCVLHVDAGNAVLHVLFKFAAGAQIVLHRHKALNKTLVIQGEHRLYHADGALKAARPVGSFTVSPASEEPHREGGGETDAIVLFAMYGDGLLYELLDDDGNVIGALAARDIAAFYDGAPA